jgi:hypothetical protein
MYIVFMQELPVNVHFAAPYLLPYDNVPLLGYCRNFHIDDWDHRVCGVSRRLSSRLGSWAYQKPDVVKQHQTLLVALIYLFYLYFF